MKLGVEVEVKNRPTRTTRATEVTSEAWPATGKGLQGSYLQLIPMLQRARGNSRCGVFALTATNPAEGVTYVVRALARQLAALPSERVLITTMNALVGLSPIDVISDNEPFIEVEPNIWSTPDMPAPHRRASVAVSPELVAALRQEFSVILIDCRALRVSPEVLRVAPLTDGLLLVVAAGEALREQVAQVQRVIQIATTKLLGCILNKRTYPIPDVLYRHL